MSINFWSLIWTHIAFVSLNIRAEQSTCYFEFPTLQGNTVTAYRHNQLDITFRIYKTCSSFNTISWIKIHKTENDREVLHCLFPHKEGRCMLSNSSKCKCPEDGSDKYHFVLSGDQLDSGTWSWSTMPAVVQEQSIEVLILRLSSTTTGSSQSEMLQRRSSEHTETSPKKFQDTTTTPEAPAFFTESGLIILVVASVGVVSVVITLAVVCHIHKLKEGKVVPAPLYRGSNVSLTIYNDLYEESPALPIAGAPGAADPHDADGHSPFEDLGDYAEINPHDKDQGACGGEDLYVSAADVRRKKREQQLNV